MENENKKSDFLLPASILIAGIFISGSIVYLVGSKNQTAGLSPNDQLAQVGAGGKTLPEISSRDVILGEPKAPVSLIEYGDYQCPWCGKFFDEVEEPLRNEYIKTGKVKMVYRNFAFLGPESFAAAEAAECAKDQSQFWAFHDAIYKTEVDEVKNRIQNENNGNLTRDFFLKIASDLKLDTKIFTTCFDNKKYESQIKQDNDAGRAAGVTGTPGLFVNGQQVGGFIPFVSLKASIDNFLKTN